MKGKYNYILIVIVGNMKIGIVTIMDYNNYGNRLQNYAVTYILKKYFKCNVVTIATERKKAYCDGNKVQWLKEQLIQRMCSYSVHFEDRYGVETTRWANFMKWNQNIPTRILYNSEKLPTSLNKEFDYFFVGSDQVWNYNFSAKKFDDYFLKFAHDEKKVALSASLGISDIEPEWENVFVENLASFSYISVREDAGALVLEKLLKKEIPVLIDPVMMLNKEEWLKVSKKPRVNCERPYVIKYFLGDDDEKVKQIEVWAKNNGFEIYELLNKDIPQLYSAGPGEFISLINNATLVCSDSFHCLVFSIIFKKPLIAFNRLGKQNNMSSRIENLLSKFGFQNRWSHLVMSEDYLKCDFEFSQKVLKVEIDRFLDYIRKIIEN